MDRGTTTYVVLQYAAMIGVILAILAAIEAIAGDVPFWVGLAVALAVGLSYPWVTRKVGIAPTQWE